MNDIVDYDDAEQSPRRRRSIILAASMIAAASVIGGLIILISSDPTRSVTGTPVANVAEVSQYAAGVQAQELAAAVEAEELYMSNLEAQTLQGMQAHFAEPDNTLFLPLYIYEVGLIRTGDSTFEGTAEMQLEGYGVHHIPINVTADGRNFLWQIAPGALVALLG